MNDFTNWLMGHNEIALSDQQRATHTYVIGQSGTGKSRALESWILQDIAAGHGVGVIDPHGELYQHLVARLAAHPKVWPRVILFDPLDADWTVGFNPLERVGGTASERLASTMTDVTLKVWRIDSASAPRMVWLLSNTFLALVELNLTLLDLPRFLLDADYREGLIARITQPAVRQYFENEFPKTERGSLQWVTPVLNKLGNLLFDPDIRLIFGSQNTFDFRRAMDERLIFLAHLPKGILGEGSSALLAAFLVAHIQRSALSRADCQRRPPFYLYLDEFQNYTTGNIIDILSESRKYALSLTLAHQFLDQLPNELCQAVLNTSGTMACFRVGYHDARSLAKEIFPSPDFQYRVQLRASLSIPYIQQIGWEGLALELANLQPRQFWYRRRGPYIPIKQHTYSMPDPVYTRALKDQIKALRDCSGSLYGRRKAASETDSRFQGDHGETDIPLWST
ncbi:MAG: hypothetical protein PWQ55_1478 [Chloroflexota bacterium]|nr:hypothetical protein [Chloroflexota bacterium]